MKRRLRCLIGLILVFLCAAVTVGSRQLHGQTVVATVPVGNQPVGVCVNPDTNRVYVANTGSNNVSVIDSVTNQVLITIRVGREPHGVCVNPNTNRVYVANWDNDNISVIDEAKKQVSTIKVGRRPCGVCVNPKTNRVYVTNDGSDNVSVIDGATNQVIAIVPVENDPRGVCVNPQTNRVYVANLSDHDFRNEGWNYSDDKVSVIDGATNKVIATIKAGIKPNGVCVNPNTNRVYVTNEVGGNVRVISGATNQVVATVSVKSDPRGIGVNPNTNRVYVTNDGIGKVSVIDGATNQVIAMVPVESYPRGVCVNPNTNRVYVSNLKNNTVSVIDGAATNPVSKRRDEFVKKNSVEEWPDTSEFYANPFIYEGKIIALRVIFGEMQTATQGIFGVGNAPTIIVSDIPKGLFKKSGLVVVLAGRVLGKTELQVPLLGLRQVPHLKFVGVHFCKENDCNDIIQ